MENENKKDDPESFQLKTGKDKKPSQILTDQEKALVSFMAKIIVNKTLAAQTDTIDKGTN